MLSPIQGTPLLSPISTSFKPLDTMDGDDVDMSVTDDTPSEAVELSSYERQRASLQTYINSLPYECESIEEMEEKLEQIVSKIYICAKAKNWLVLSTWDGMLQCWLLMRYPMTKSTRAKLVRLYYELCLLPGLEPRVIRSWSDMLNRLLANKPGIKRKLETSDLELPWQPLWRTLQKELWPKKRAQDSSRNVVNILLYVAELCKRYFPSQDIPAMLDLFLPLLTKETILAMIPVLTSFLPPTHTHLYLPTLFSLWEAFNSTVIDDRLLDLAGALSEEFSFSAQGEAEDDGSARKKDIGMWTQPQWDLLVGKGLQSMKVPVGTSQGASSTANHADAMADNGSLRIKKSIDRYHAIAKILVHSMSVDGDVRNESNQRGYVAGCKALDSLDRLITSTESFFHPSNSGPWTNSLTAFLQRLTAEFNKRINEEDIEACRTPIGSRLTPAIRRTFVSILRTPALLAMFSKDPTCMSYAQGSLRSLALLEPAMIMPDLLERAYGGLEIVNETHRTTAVLSMLSGVARPLVSEDIWLGGQKHLLPLLELCIPGIDLNDPTKTICATMFIVAAVQHIKIGDLTLHPSGILESSDDEEESVEADDNFIQNETPRLSRADERSLTRDSTAGFADWVTSLLRRVLALYENLPEEGGRKNTTGGKQEESVLKAIKSMMDVICLHLSDQLFDLVLNLLYDYATTNAKSNAVQAFGQLVACLARVKPEQTMAKFLPFCISQIEEELMHGASSVRTTSSHAAIPSDTTLHWNLAILRGCLGYGGPVLLKYKQQIINLLTLLVDKTKGERGYTSTGRLVTRVLHTVAGVYPLNSRFVNTDEWEDPGFDQDHNLQWGLLYEPEDVVIEWHVPSSEEITFTLDILDKLCTPALDRVEALLENTATWDNVSRNDFCRSLHVCRAIWGGLPTLFKEQRKETVNPCLNKDIEIADLIVSFLDVNAGFTLTDPKDPRYQKVVAIRSRFGDVCQRAASALRKNTGGEDHIDAVIGVARAIDTFMLGYGLGRNDYDSLQKNYTQARDLNRAWPKQRDNSRLVFVKRAQVYHSGRVYMHALYRRRSALDDKLIGELVELSLSPYTRVRRQAQTVLHSVCGYFVRSTRLTLPVLFDALSKGNDPDRMKGALYVLWNKGTAAYALGDIGFHNRYLLSLLESQHEEKPSIQKLVNNLAQDCQTHLNEEAVHTDAYVLETPRVDEALHALESEFSADFISHSLLNEAMAKTDVRVVKRNTMYKETVSSILEVALRPGTHWRYVQMASRFLFGLLRRDVPTPPDVVQFFLEQSTSPQPTIRVYVQRALVKLLTFIKYRTYSTSKEQLWLAEWTNPLAHIVPITNPSTFSESLNQPHGSPYVDKIPTGFLTWAPNIKVYEAAGNAPTISWDATSGSSLRLVSEILSKGAYFEKLSLLWSQESGKSGGTIDLRKDNVAYIKSLAKMFGAETLEGILSAIDPLLSDIDKFKQRAGAEILSGILRGSKHWPKPLSDRLWSWTTNRLDRIFAQIKPDTLSFWEGFFQHQLRDRDPRRNHALVAWILALPLDFNGDSAFAMSKPLSILGILLESLGVFFNAKSEGYIKLMFENANTGYAEMRGHICQILFTLLKNQWRPTYPSTQAFLLACETSEDPLHLRDAKSWSHVTTILDKLPQWREERLPPPRYDKVGLTVLQWIWVSAHGAQASLIFPYVVPMMPEILRMSELNDSSDLQIYSSAVLYVLSAVSPPVEYIEGILRNFVTAIKSSKSWRIRLHALPALVVFFYRNLLSISQEGVLQVMEVLLVCLGDENVEVREMASKVLSGVIRCSQRQNIIPLKASAIMTAMTPSHSDLVEPVCRLGPENYSASKG
ncbi:hypothetical protein BDZ94DRAFT_1312356 [Collybia nuda]|uniref:Proteasome activator subunit 4 n=1 Tax=Collybia nuda TaxID=64659 RepID=A0A9P5XZG1_9AGAR|nr:hypothetical protein BDZ94DRAFT_1312356 [Collybia nuda]